jgi:phosphoserine aminotransferase
MLIDRPGEKPDRPYFSSGPCAKPPGWGPEHLALGSLGRSHRSKLGKARLGYAIELTRKILRVPPTHRIGIVPASDTGAVEMALWSLLGPRPVTMLAWESFGEGWVTDVLKQLKLDAAVLKAPYGQLPDLSAVDPASDVVFTWNGTTSGARVPDGDWIGDAREGLTIADATSAAFAQQLPWEKLDVATFSWQKVLGGEGGHGVLILGPRAGRAARKPRPRLAPPEDLPANQACPERRRGGREADRRDIPGRDDQHALDAGGRGLYLCARMGAGAGRALRADRPCRRQRSRARRVGAAHSLDRSSRRRSGNPIEHQRLPEIRGHGRADARFEGQMALVKRMASLLEAEGAAFDIASYRDAPPGLRIWCGATVETDDIIALGPWLDWAFQQARAS